jgi:hypothetical protein
LYIQDKFEDTKGVTRSRKSKMTDITMTIGKSRNNDL